MLTKTRIAHLSSVHPDGDTRIFHKMCVSLARNGADVHLVLAGVEPRTERDVRIHGVPKYHSRFRRAWTTVNDVYAKAIEIDADIYHIHDPELLRIGRKLIKKGKSVIYDSHEDLPRQILSKQYLKFRTLVSYASEFYENKIVGQLSGVIAATPTISKRFIEVNPNCIDVNNFPLLDELALADSSENKPITSLALCYVGGISKARGIHELLEVATDNREVILAGKFESAALEADVISHKNWKNIDYRGFVGREEVKEIYSSSLAGLVALHPVQNYLDALPVKMFEYMATGTAVIASNFPLWRSIVEESNCGLCVDPLKPEEISTALSYLANNRELATELGSNGRKAVLEKYNWSIEEAKLLDFYKSIISKDLNGDF